MTLETGEPLSYTQNIILGYELIPSGSVVKLGNFTFLKGGYLRLRGGRSSWQLCVRYLERSLQLLKRSEQLCELE